ncbi:MAG: starch-binding protein [Paludibacteraceae bacterium]|nr:starch-binding protein [Paludibacteraceae bacterium]
MKKLSFFLMAMLMSVMSFAQTTESVVLASGVHDGSKITWTIANGNITISQLKAASSTAVNASYISAPRMYKGHIFKFETAEGYAITNIDITYNGSYYGTDLFAGTVISNDNTVTKNTTDITATYSTATGGTHKIATTSAEGESMIALQIPNSAASGYKQLRPTAIKITYVKAATTTPNISCGDVTFGTVNSINNNTKEVEVVGENLSEAITATLETGAAFSVEGTLNANGGILTIKVTATEEGNYTDNLVLTSGTTTKTVAVSAKVVTCEGKGTKEAPYTVSDLTKLGNPGTKAWVMGYIIGEIKDNELSTSGFESNSNIALADAIGETKKYAPIQLPSGAIRDALNLVSNPANLNKQVALYGTLEAYFSMPGVKSVSEYEWVVAPVVNHTITVSANPAEGGVVTGGDEYEEGATATLTATANEGYEFVNWTENEVEVSTDAEYTFEVLADRTLVANFEKAAPATETVYFIDAKNWGKVNVYAWTTDPNASWPGAAATKEAEQIAGYDVYSFTANAGQYANVIFNDGSSQTDDLVWTAGKYYVIDGWYTKEEAEAKLAAPIADIWTVAGAPASIFGTEWDPSNAANDLVKQEDGTYKWEKTDLTLSASNIQFKVVKNHAWGEEYPGSNYTLSIAEAGIYTITITFNADTKEVAGTATKTGSAVVIPTIAIAGDMNGWNTTANEFVVAADELTASLTLPLEAQDYGFKIIVAGGWTSNAATITRENNTAEFTENGDNSTLTADVAGEYTFTWTYATKTLTVTYPALPVKYNVTVTAENGTVEGAGEYEEGTEVTLTATPADGYEFVNWTSGETEVSTANPFTFTVTSDTTLVANFKAVEPEVIAYELNGGEFPEVKVPTNAELWGTDTADVNGLMHYFNHYYDLKRSAQDISAAVSTNPVATFLTGMPDDAGIFVDEESKYKWLGDYIVKVTNDQIAEGTLSVLKAVDTNIKWRYGVQAFFMCLPATDSNYKGWADFTEAGKPEAWGAAYQAAHAVVLPTEPVAEDYVLPTPVKEGYKFVGWYDNAEGTGEAYTVIPAGWSGTLYAIWEVEGPATALENIAVEGKAVKAIINGQLIIIKNGVQYNAQGAVVK